MLNNASDSLHAMIYLDHNATTPLSKDVVNQMPLLLQEWGNPSSIHLKSRGPKTILRETRKLFAEYLKCTPTEIIFNSGASEGNNTVLKSVWQSLGSSKNEMIISQVEHPSVMKTAQYLETLGAKVHYIPVDRTGKMDLEFIRKNLNSKTALVSVMFANNETGNVFPIAEISKMTQANQTLLHVDCVQTLGKYDLQFDRLGVDYATFSAHKFYALKGTGVLYVKKGSPYINLIHGGGQERARRGGTENVLGIATLQIMMTQLKDISAQLAYVKSLRDVMESQIIKQIPSVKVTACETERLANTSSLVLDGVDGETLLMSLDLKGFAVSTGAACSSGNPEPSPVLLAMGLTRAEAQNSLRISLGWKTTQTEIDLFITTLVEVVARIRGLQTESVKHHG